MIFLSCKTPDQFLGGYVKWFTDIPAFNGYPTTVLFPREEEMTMINIGPRMDPQSVLTDLSTKDWALRGVKNRFTAPYFPSLHYSKTYDAELIVDLLKSYKDITDRFRGIRPYTCRFLQPYHIKSEPESNLLMEQTWLMT